MNRETVTVELDDGIAWVALDRPEKRNAMNPTLNAEMVEVLLELDADDRCGVLVLTGAGDSFSAGMDLKEYFREVDAQPEHVQRHVRRDANYWQWRLLRTYPKPTIAMVNGWCFGGAFTPLCACDLAVAADEATSASPRSTGASRREASSAVASRRRSVRARRCSTS
jgi:trans-feruloyl-CoA hydratase/vanillin synthase